METTPQPELPRREKVAYAALYTLLAEEEDARVCRDIPDAACHEQPAAFTLQLAAQTLSKLGDALSSSRLVLAWILTSLGAPAIYLSLLVPLRESLSLLPQLAVAQALRKRPLRKGFWVAGGFIQAAALAAMVPALFLFGGHALGMAVCLLLAVFSLARGVCSVAAKDVLGKTVSKSRRGRLTGLAGSAAGLATLAVAGVLVVAGGRDAAESGLFAGLLAAAALAWAAAALVYARVPEVPGATEGGGNALDEALRSLRLLRDDAPFRDFVIARSLLVATAFAIPYLVVLLRASGAGDLALGTLLLAEGLAALLSAPFWGFWSDVASHRVMAAAALLSALGLGLALLLAGQGALGSGFVGAALLFLCAVAHQGARVGRKTYLVDLASGENRAAYTAVSNTVLGIVLFAGVGLGVIDTFLGTPAVLAALALIALAAALRCGTLQRVD
ncbi:MFS transporter [Pseudohaliea sp.]|uniref:MFS transporter n=1 Tax=Pseudohaliea sp. TaxID=2740289 RepID=UPI0032EF7F21